MPKITLPIQNNQLIFPAYVSSNNADEVMRGEAMGLPVKVLFDTGATNSAIVKSIVKELDLKPISQTQIQTPAGIKNTNLYRVNIVLPFPNNNMAFGQEGLVTEIEDNKSFELIVGMDIIKKGCLVVSDNTFIFSI